MRPNAPTLLVEAEVAVRVRDVVENLLRNRSRWLRVRSGRVRQSEAAKDAFECKPVLIVPAIVEQIETTARMLGI